MKPADTFLVVDDHDLTRSLVTRALLRRFPWSAVAQCRERLAARHLAQSTWGGLVIGFADEAGPAFALVTELRALQTAAAIVVLATGIDRPAAEQAGADVVIRREDWILVPEVLAGLFRARAAAEEESALLRFPATVAARAGS
jgi:hypothetical protein